LVIEEAYTFIAIIIIFIDGLIKIQCRWGGTYDKDIVKQFSLVNGGMQVFPDDIFEQRKQNEQEEQEDGKEISTELDIAPQKEGRRAEQYGKQYDGINDKNDLFRIFVRSPVCIEP
jgi:hypothetical protein